MKRKIYVETKVNAIEIHQDRSWLWLGSLLFLITILSLGISSCSTAPAPAAESAATLPAEISINEAHKLYQEGVYFLDVRTQEEWDEFHAPNSTLIPLDQLESRLGELPQDEQIVVVCRSGNRSQTGRNILLDHGFDQVSSMNGGLAAWRSAGYPIQP
ncbi:MAG: rhodanese-like domain-containing protein [Chloroflexota bacterium]|nr:MAG: rhodanese-like domain-containing protein [Chloroflexota bacterium]